MKVRKIDLTENKLRSSMPCTAPLLTKWMPENVVCLNFVFQVHLGDFLDQATTLSDAARSEILLAVSSSLLFLYDNGYLANIQASSFMQFGDSWMLIDLFDCLYPIEDPPRELFSMGAQASVVQAIVDGAFSTLQLPVFSSLSLGLMIFELLLSSSLFPGRSSQQIVDAINEDEENTPLSTVECTMVETLQLIILGHEGRYSETEVIQQLAALLQDNILPSFEEQRRQRAGTMRMQGRRHYYSMTR